MKITLIILILIINITAQAQTKFKIVESETDNLHSIYSLVDESNRTLRFLDSEKYFMPFSGFEYAYFAVIAKKGDKNNGWPAIDANENILFYVYNISFGEPYPDYLVENKIRIVDENNRIGYANEKGEIIIKPQFEMASSFHNGYAIIAENCKKKPWGNHEHDDGCNHYSIECKKHGYIDEEGRIIKLGDFTFEEIMDEIKWIPDDAY